MSSIEDAVSKKIDDWYGSLRWVSRVKQKIDRRACEGTVHYGHTLERDDLTDVRWLEHIEDEMLDSCNYLQKMIEITSNPARRFYLEDILNRQLHVLHMFESEFSRDLIDSGK